MSRPSWHATFKDQRIGRLRGWRNHKRRHAKDFRRKGLPDKDVIDETPAAYKNIDVVMEAQRNLVDVVHTLKQVVCVKG